MRKCNILSCLLPFYIIHIFGENGNDNERKWKKICGNNRGGEIW